MKNKFKKINSLIITLVFVVNFLFSNLTFNNVINAVELEKNFNEISIRVEGLKDTLYNEKFPLNEEKTVKDVLEKSIGENNISGLSSGFVTEILGNKPSNNTMGWMYYLVDKDENILEGNMISEQNIKDLKGRSFKEMVWYMAKYTDGITCIPKINLQHDKNNYHLNIKEQNNMLGIDLRPSNEVNVKVEGVGQYKTDENGNVNFRITKGEHKVSVYKNIKDSKGEEYPSIVRQNFILIGEESETENKLEEIIKELKTYYSDKELNYLNVLSFNNLNKGEKKDFKLNQSENSASIADNIMGIIAIGKNPYSYEGKNYVEKLAKSQNEEGKFVIGDSDNNSITSLAESIIALDMASAKYDDNKAIDSLIQCADDGKFEDVDTTTKILIALSKHKELKGVNAIIDSCLKDLKDNQLEGGGFDYYGMGNSPYSTAPVIQALIALGENPTSKKWSKGGQNLLDALYKTKVSNKGFELAEGMGAGEDDITATNLAFAAIIDLYKNQSMYNAFKFNVEEPKDYNKIICNEIEDIKNFYKDSKGYNYNAALGLKLLGVSEEEINKNINLNKKDKMSAYAENIMYIISVGKNPRNYNGKNYVKLLNNKIKNPEEKRVLLKEYMNALIALEMASDTNENINSALSKAKEKFSYGGLNKVYDAAITVIALAPYKSNEEVKDIINSCIEYLKKQQLENGAFTLGKTMFKNGDSEDTALAIEAIIAAGQDPLSKEWTKNGKNPIDALLSFKMGKGYIYEVSLGAYEQEMYTAQVLRALIAVKEKTILFSKVKINYDESKDKTSLIKEALEDLRKYYGDKKEFNFREALAYNFSSNDISKDLKVIEEKLKIKADCKSASEYSGAIMSIIASGKDPRKYNNINYVNNLVKSQVKTGENIGKFMVKSGDEIWPTIQAYSILALDMAGANYDKESAIKALCSMGEDGIYSDVDTTAMVITALAPYKNIKEVKNTLDKSIKYLKENQNDQGGYSAYGDLNNPCTISVVIQALIANEIDPLKDEWIKNNNTMIDALFKSRINGTFSNDFANSEAFMALSDLYKESSMFKSIKFIDGLGLKPIIDEVYQYYLNKDNTYNYLQCLALKNIGMSKELIRDKFQLREDEPSFLNYDTDVTNLAKNIIGMQSAGLNPRNYNGKNYIDMLLNSQNEKGEFISSKDNKYSIKGQAYSILALDMCNENYNMDGINLLINEGKNLKNKGVSYVSPIIIALSNHKDIKGVNEAIENGINNLKECQLENGEFSLSKKLSGEKSSEYTSEAIQALVAAGEDVLSNTWSKNGKTPIDALLTYKKGDHFIYDNIKSSYKEFTDEANGMALAALVDVYNGESMFKCDNSKLSKNSTKVKIENLNKNKEFNLGGDAKVRIKAKNIDNKDRNVTLIVALYNENGEFVNYSSSKQTLKSGQEVELESMIKLPKEGKYQLKAFVWDDFEKMTPLSDEINFSIVK